MTTIKKRAPLQDSFEDLEHKWLLCNNENHRLKVFLAKHGLTYPGSKDTPKKEVRERSPSKRKDSKVISFHSLSLDIPKAPKLSRKFA